MVKLKSEDLTQIGKVIGETGLSLNYVIEKSGISRNRLTNLRTSKSATLSFKEARQLAPVLKLSLEQLAQKIDEQNHI